MDWCVKGRRKVWRAPERSTEGAGRISWSVQAPNQETEQSIVLASEGSQFREMCANMPGSLSRVPVGRLDLQLEEKALPWSLKVSLAQGTLFYSGGTAHCREWKGLWWEPRCEFSKMMLGFFSRLFKLSTALHVWHSTLSNQARWFFFFFFFFLVLRFVCFCVFVRRKYTVYKVNQDL